jgi:hypothetical protein
MGANFDIAVDAARSLVRLEIAGLFSPDDVRRLSLAVIDARRARGCSSTSYVVLCDARGMRIQPQGTVTAFQSLLADPQHRASRLAFAIPRSLARAQLSRVLGGRTVRIFDDLTSAEAWVLTGEEPRERMFQPMLRSA